MSSPFHLTCLLCPAAAQPQLPQTLLAFQAHLLDDHQVSQDDLAEATCTAPSSVLAELYVYRLPDGRAWLRAEKLRGLVHSGMLRGHKPRQLAEALDLSIDLLARLDAASITLETIPAALLARLAEVLAVEEVLVRAYLAGPAHQPTFPHGSLCGKSTFSEALSESVLLSEEQRQRWRC
jgi:hypothetical protein